MNRKMLFGLLLSVSLSAFAQEESVDDLYLKISAETRIIDSQASSPSRDLKTMAVDDLTAMNEEGRLNGNDPFVMRIISNLASEGTGIISTSNGRIINNYPIVRQKACLLLGNINTQQAADALIELATMETESMVLSEIVLGISKNTAADPVDVVNTVQGLMYDHGNEKDHNFAFAYLMAVENMAKNGIEIQNPDVYSTVSEMTLPESGYIQIVTDKAMDVLRNIR